MVRAGAVGYVGKDQSADDVLRAIHRSAYGRATISVRRLGEVAERLAEHDDALLAAYVRGQPPRSYRRLRRQLATTTQEARIHPRP